MCDELRIPYPAGTTSARRSSSTGSTVTCSRRMRRGRRTVLIIDEAQNLSPEVLEEVRLLTNLETTTGRSSSR